MVKKPIFHKNTFFSQSLKIDLFHEIVDFWIFHFFLRFCHFWSKRPFWKKKVCIIFQKKVCLSKVAENYQNDGDFLYIIDISWNSQNFQPMFWITDYLRGFYIITLVHGQSVRPRSVFRYVRDSPLEFFVIFCKKLGHHSLILETNIWGHKWGKLPF